VEKTYSQRLDLKIACCFTLKNLLFRQSKEIRDLVMRLLTPLRLVELLCEDSVPQDQMEESKGEQYQMPIICLQVQEQALMIYRNILQGTDKDI
jgi:hypothetical protein